MIRCAIRRHRVPLPRLSVDEPTLEMVFQINSSPFAGRDGQFVTTRQLKTRLMKELERNVALRVRPVPGTDHLAVAGRGVLHLVVLIENMRREGYELSVGKPHVVLRDNNGAVEEPFESLVVEVPSEKLGPVMEFVGANARRPGAHGSPWRLHVRYFSNSSPRSDRSAHPVVERYARDGDYAQSVRRLRPHGR